MDQIHLAIVEDNFLFNENLSIFFEKQLEIDSVVSYESVEEFLEEIKLNKKINTLLLDIELPGLSGLEGIPHIKKGLKEIDIIILTSHEDSDKIFAALSLGANAYLSKKTSLPKIKEAVMIVKHGGSFLSPDIAKKVFNHFAPKKPTDKGKLSEKQIKIIESIIEGLSYKMIADKLSTSIDNVRYHIKKIYRMLEVNSQTELIHKRIKGEI